MVERCPYFSLACGGWVPAVVTRDPETGFFHRVERPDAFTRWRENDEASRFLRPEAQQ
jgi:hypothetical protein